MNKTMYPSLILLTVLCFFGCASTPTPERIGIEAQHIFDVLDKGTLSGEDIQAIRESTRSIVQASVDEHKSRIRAERQAVKNERDAAFWRVLMWSIVGVIVSYVAYIAVKLYGRIVGVRL